MYFKSQTWDLTFSSWLPCIMNLLEKILIILFNTEDIKLNQEQSGSQLTTVEGAAVVDRYRKMKKTEVISIWKPCTQTLVDAAVISNVLQTSTTTSSQYPQSGVGGGLPQGERLRQHLCLCPDQTGQPVCRQVTEEQPLFPCVRFNRITHHLFFPWAADQTFVSIVSSVCRCLRWAISSGTSKLLQLFHFSAKIS